MKKPYLALLITIVIFATCLAFTGQLWGISADDFTLSIVHDQYPVREIDNRAAIPFDTEYRIRLKNGHNRKCTAKVFIDGSPISKLGDFILDAKTEIDLERFLDSSLTEGKRFKFVRLNHPDVDDPGRAENGIVRVEFRLQKKPALIIQEGDIIIQEYGPKWWELDDKVKMRFNLPETTIEPMNNFTSDSSSVLCSNNSATEPGATIAGSKSNQTFHKSHIDVEDEVYALELRMVGITEVSSYYP